MIICGTDYVIIFGGALRVGEVFLTEVCEIVKIVSDGKLDT